MTSGEVASKRRRGVVLTLEGQRKLRDAIAQIQEDEYDGQKLTIEKLSERTNLDPGTISKVLDAEQGVDRRTLQSFFQALNLDLSDSDYCKATVKLGNSQENGHLSIVPPLTQPAPLALHIDWGEAPDVSIFYGRTDELDRLEQWIVGDRCRLVTVLGMGGIGKTSLIARLIERIVGGRKRFRTASLNSVPEPSTSKFEFVVWYSLRNAPTVEETLSYLVRFLDGQSGTVLPKSLDSLILLLLQRLEQSRCLVVLDNTESILRGGERTGAYRDGYAGYGALIRRVGEVPHQSCLILTSREMPREVGVLEGQARPVRVLQLSGLQPSDGVRILEIEGLSERSEEQQQLLDRYSGNPLALKIAAHAIHEYFGGDVASFFIDGAAMFGDIRDLLDSQFERLMALDREVMYWLAINREPVTFAELMEEIVSPIKRPQLLEVLESLVRRSLIESSEARFTLQNVVMEYVTNRFVEQVCEELRNGRFELLHTHALIEATVKDYVRETQVRLILKPIAGSLAATPPQWQEWLQVCRSQPQLSSGYVAGNVLNLMCCSGREISGYDFSGLTVRHAYLKGARLQDVSFAQADFIKPALTHPFSSVLSVAFSPDGTLLATATANGDILLWQVAGQQHVASLQGHTSSIWTIAFSPDGQMLASGSTDYTIRLWNVQTQKCLVLKEHTDQVYSVAFSPDGRTLASGSSDHTIRLWDLDTQQCLHVLQEDTGWISSVAFSPDGKILASGSSDRTVRLWDLQNQQCLHIFREHNRAVRSVAFSPDGRTLASGSSDHTIRLWDLDTQQCLHVLQKHKDTVLTIAFSLDGTALASGSSDQTVCLWDLQNRSYLCVLQGHRDRVRCVAFSPDSKTIASGSDDQTVRLWDKQTHQCEHLFKGYFNRILSVAFSPHGKLLANGSRDSSICLWDMTTQQRLNVFQGHGNTVRSVAFSPDSKTIVSGSDDHTIRLWDIQTQRCLHVFQEHCDYVRSVVFSPDGKLLASGSNDRTIRLWDVHGRRCLHVFQGHTQRVRSVTFSPNGELLASSGADQIIRLWNVKTQQCLQILQGHTSTVRSIAFSLDGRFLASGSKDGTVHLWDIQSWKCLQVFKGHTNSVFAIVFSPDSKMIASGSEDQTVRLWNIQTCQCLTILGHDESVLSVAFSPNQDQPLLASGTADATIKLWNLRLETCLATLKLPRPYEDVDITGATGFSNAQRRSLIILGALEKRHQS